VSVYYPFGPSDIVHYRLNTRPKVEFASGTAGWRGSTGDKGEISLYGGIRSKETDAASGLTIQPIYDIQTNTIDGNWHMITGVYNGSHASIYVDGKFEGSNAQTLWNITSESSTTRIGMHSPGNAFNGTIDEVKIYPRALTDEEVLCRYGNNCSLYGLWNDTSALEDGYYYYTARSSEGENYTTTSLLLPLLVTKNWFNISEEMTFTESSGRLVNLLRLPAQALMIASSTGRVGDLVRELYQSLSLNSLSSRLSDMFKPNCTDSGIMYCMSDANIITQNIFLAWSSQH